MGETRAHSIVFVPGDVDSNGEHSCSFLLIERIRLVFKYPINLHHYIVHSDSNWLKHLVAWLLVFIGSLLGSQVLICRNQCIVVPRADFHLCSD